MFSASSYLGLIITISGIIVLTLPTWNTEQKRRSWFVVRHMKKKGKKFGLRGEFSGGPSYKPHPDEPPITDAAAFFRRFEPIPNRMLLADSQIILVGLFLSIGGAILQFVFQG